MRILAINVEIGYGHPNYLDYVLQAIKKIQPETKITYWDVLTQEKGFAKLFWQMAKLIYIIGAKGGILTDAYNKLRRQVKASNLPICNVAKPDFDRIIVSHPLLARYLQNVWYIHGEIALPKECILHNVEKIIVPINYTTNKLIVNGISKKRILESGLLIAPDLVANAEENCIKRVSRIESNKSLTIGFFISGAYPVPHINKIIDAIGSIQKTRHRIVIFLGTERKKADAFLTRLNRKAESLQKRDFLKNTILFVQGNTRFDYQKRVNRFVPLLDVFVAPSHEYTNWALGLGLPILTLFPMIGSYAQENFDFLTEQAVTCPIKSNDDACNLIKIIQELHGSGMLSEMAKNGLNKFPIDGAIKTAQAIAGN